MEEKIKNMMMSAAKLMSNLADIQSGKFSQKGIDTKLDEVEYYLAEINCELSNINK